MLGFRRSVAAPGSRRDAGRHRSAQSRAGWPVFAAVTAFVSAPGLAAAGSWETGGHIKYQATYTDYRASDLAAVLGDEHAVDQGLDLRMKAEGRSGSWDASAHYEVLAVAGDSVAARRLDVLGFAGGTVAGLPDDRRRLFDLADVVEEGGRAVAVQRLDRLALGYSRPRQVWRFGRQAVSWGNGLVFQVLDFVNPFSPIAIDKEYKTGDDMLYGQWVAEPGSDLQAMLVPRRDPVTGDLESDQSSLAAKLRTAVGATELDVLVARHVGDDLAGVGVVRSVGGAVWRVDATVTGLEDRRVVSWLTNLDYSWTWLGRNTYGYAEYFRNGFGETGIAGYSAPDPALAARLARGELYTLARDYAALGLQIELTPLVNVYNNLIVNLNDGSRFYQLRGVYGWRQNVELQVGVNLPGGERGEEFGGVPVGGGVFVAPGRALYARAAYYF